VPERENDYAITRIHTTYRRTEITLKRNNETLVVVIPPNVEIEVHDIGMLLLEDNTGNAHYMFPNFT
jgi:hypothetical protein